MVVAGDRHGRPCRQSQPGCRRRGKPADGLAERKDYRHFVGSQAGQGEQLGIPGSRRHVEGERPAGERGVCREVPRQVEGDELGHTRPVPQAGEVGGLVLAQPQQLRQRVLGLRAQARPSEERRGPDLPLQPGGLPFRPRIVPRQDVAHGQVSAIDGDAGFGHAGDADGHGPVARAGCIHALGNR